MYKTGRIKVVAVPGELGEIRTDEGYMIYYGVDDIDELAFKRWKKKSLGEGDHVHFRVSKENFAVDLAPSGVAGAKQRGGKNI